MKPIFVSEVQGAVQRINYVKSIWVTVQLWAFNTYCLLVLPYELLSTKNAC